MDARWRQDELAQGLTALKSLANVAKGVIDGWRRSSDRWFAGPLLRTL